MFPGIGIHEMLIFGVIALLLFGKRLPEVARSMGKALTEFKRGVSGIEEELTDSVRRPVAQTHSRPMPVDDRTEITAPRFELPAQEPVAQTDADRPQSST